MPSNSSTAPKRNVLASVLGLLGMSGIAGVLVAALMTPLLAVAGVAANSTITLFESLPDYLEITPLQQKTELYAMRGDKEEKFAEFYSQNRVEVPLDEMSPYLIDAVIATEDPRFYDHGGVDVMSASRAVLESVMSDDGSGASTITMQFVRNQRVQAAEAILDPVERQQAYNEATERSAGRKLQEMRLAIGVEKQYSKDQILEGYLNIALFGGQIYGVESAAQYYFGKSAKDLSLGEAALIGGMVQNPNRFRVDQEEKLESATNRRNYVLRRMYEEGKIDKAEYEEAKATEIQPNITPTRHGCMNATENTEFFCDYVRKVILNDPAFGSTYEERLFNFQTKGYQIHTTLDLEMQDHATGVLKQFIPAEVDYMNLGAAVSIVQPGTGNILAMTQNKEFDETDKARESRSATSINYNADMAYGGSLGFPAASAYKVFTLTNWVQSGHSVNENVNARNRAFNLANFQDSCGEHAPYGGTWSPGNEDNAKYNTVSATKATMLSINTAFVAMGEQLDQCVTRDIAMGMGAHRADGKVNDSRPSSSILGTNEIAPLSMATAYAGFANQGESCAPRAIKSMTLRDGEEIAPPEPDCNQVITRDVANAVNHVLKQVAETGYSRWSNPGLGPMIAKTGTSDNARDAWSMAATTGAGIAVWIGNTDKWQVGTNWDGTPAYDWVSLYDVPLGTSRGDNVRHDIMKPIMQRAIEKYGAEDWPAPNPDALRSANVSVPDVTGMSIDSAKSTLESAGFSVAVGDAVDSDQPANTVAKTNPTANTSVPSGSTVNISPSTGRKPNEEKPEAGEHEMPDLRGMTTEEAQDALRNAGFENNGSNWFQAHERGTAGRVTRTDPPAGSMLTKDAKITIYVGE